MEEVEEGVTREGTEIDPGTKAVEGAVRILSHGSEKTCGGACEDIPHVAMGLDYGAELAFRGDAVLDDDLLDLVENDDNLLFGPLGEPLNGLERFS